MRRRLIHPVANIRTRAGSVNSLKHTAKQSDLGHVPYLRGYPDEGIVILDAGAGFAVEQQMAPEIRILRVQDVSRSQERTLLVVVWHIAAVSSSWFGNFAGDDSADGISSFYVNCQV